MPRKPRIEVPGHMYHIISRGIEKRDIFRSDIDKHSFLNRLGRLLVDTKINCLAFVLMPNHFHLLLISGPIPISTLMRRLLTGYAIYFNKKYKRMGHLFQNRYKSIICQEDSYLLELIRYIHLNPIRAKIIPDLKELSIYLFSGHCTLVDKVNYEWYSKDIVLNYFGKTKKQAKQKYLAFINDGINMDRDSKYTGGGLKRSLGYPKTYPKEKQAFDERILGNSEFVLNLQWLEEKKKDNNINQKIYNLLDKIAVFYNLEREQIQGKGQTTKLKEARHLFAYAAAVFFGLSFAEIARYLNIHRSNAARMLKRIKINKEQINYNELLQDIRDK